MGTFPLSLYIVWIQFPAKCNNKHIPRVLPFFYAQFMLLWLLTGHVHRRCWSSIQRDSHQGQQQREVTVHDDWVIFPEWRKKRHQKLAILIHLVYKSLMRAFMTMVYWYTTRTHIDPISCLMSRHLFVRSISQLKPENHIVLIYNNTESILYIGSLCDCLASIQ